MKTYPELIFPANFDEKFRKLILDYYTYGYKASSEVSDKKKATVKVDCQRLDNIVKEAKVNETNKKGESVIQFIIPGSEHQAINPFHRLYMFGGFRGIENPRTPAFFFHICSSLSNAVTTTKELFDDTYAFGFYCNRFFEAIDKCNLSVSECDSFKNDIFFFLLKKTESEFITYNGFLANEDNISIYTEIVDRYITKIAVKKEFKELPDKINKRYDEIESAFYSNFIDRVLDKIDVSTNSKDDISTKIFNFFREYKCEEMIGRYQLFEKMKEDYNSIIREFQIHDDERRMLVRLPDSVKQKYIEQEKAKEEIILQRLSAPKKLNEIYYYCEGMFKEAVREKNRKKVLKDQLINYSEIGFINSLNGSLWNLKNPTISDLISISSNIGDFEYRFRMAIDFYSRSFILGEIGTFILNRIHKSDINPFRFKHDYYMQVLNDYLVMDLLAAIDCKDWCIVRYKHGTSNVKTRLLVFPLQIRVSNQSGREYLVYYEPFKRSCSSLRVEFIDSFSTITEIVAKDIIMKHDPSSLSTINQDINNSIKLMERVWGTSTSIERNGNVVSLSKPYLINMIIQYDKQTEQYIYDRINRERRFGKIISFTDSHIEFEIEVADYREILPWIYTFFKRIVSLKINACIINVKSELVTILNDDRKQNQASSSSSTYNDVWSIPDNPEIMEMVNRYDTPQTNYKLFNEFFSVYYLLLGDVFSKLCDSRNKDFSNPTEIKKYIKEICRECAKGRKTMIGTMTQNELTKMAISMFLDYGFFVFEKNSSLYRFKYSSIKSFNMFRDIIPLSEVENRWLLSILDDERMFCFLSESEIEVIKNEIKQNNSNYTPYNTTNIKCFDRYIISDEMLAKEYEHIPKILKAIKESNMVEISYITKRGNEITQKIAPIILCFSKKKNQFQCIGQDYITKNFPTFLISRINSIKPTSSVFNYKEALDAYTQYKTSKERSVVVEFTDTHNLADRLLTEFAPWKKSCELNGDRFSLTIYYDKDDSFEIIIKLMSYNTHISFPNASDPISEGINERLRKQLMLDNSIKKSIEHNER